MLYAFEKADTRRGLCRRMAAIDRSYHKVLYRYKKLLWMNRILKFGHRYILMQAWCNVFLTILLRSCMHGPNQKFGSIRISVIRNIKRRGSGSVATSFESIGWAWGENSNKPKNRNQSELRSLRKDNHKSNLKSNESKIRINGWRNRITPKTSEQHLYKPETAVPRSSRRR